MYTLCQEILTEYEYKVYYIYFIGNTPLEWIKFKKKLMIYIKNLNSIWM